MSGVAALSLSLIFTLLMVASAEHDYGQALSKSILFFEAQRSGYLPADQRVYWRGNSGLHDGMANGVDLVGGYYDAGDNVKFGLPMAFTVTMIAWGVAEYGRQMETSGELGHAMEAIKWGTDYLLKAHPQPFVLYGEVGDGNTDHHCWQRPEDMTTSRLAYRIDANRPGSDLAGETAAAMAAASMVFLRSNPAYSRRLLSHARQLFEFADKYRGKYDHSILVAQNYYGSFSGYEDELLWAAAWLYHSTQEQQYLDYIANNGDALGGTEWDATEFGWDVKYAGVQVLAAKFFLQGREAQPAPVLERYQQKAESFMCSCIGRGTNNVQRTPGGLLFHQSWNNLQFVTGAAFLLTVYSDYLSSAGRSAACASGATSPAELLSFAKSQVDYILGDNPRGTSYMVGYGDSFPRKVHHRGSSIVSIKVSPATVSCREGYDTWFARKQSNPNVLVGAIVGGPDADDNFVDERYNYDQTEPTTYNNAPILGVLARLHGGHGGYNQLLSGAVPLPSMPVGRKPSSQAFAIEQRQTTSWNNRGKTYYRYAAVVTNKSARTAVELKLSVSQLYGPIWGLANSGDKYTFPEWLSSLPGGKSFDFVYIQAAPPAVVTVAGYKLIQ
ncbi:endoglucanase 6-like [Zingiber officinale]|uniref:endoglucanase 6-like n=1 Tax=Zingiber officinale TaxID=94328 RepID=UPI001C4D3846|nr:endoglucanase 6-like [Zingiber officinale]